MDRPICFAPGLYAGGQPSFAQLTALQQQGVNTVINLRPVGEMGEEAQAEAKATQELGLDYHILPIRGAEDLTAENVNAFAKMLTRAQERGGVLIHCASGNRVGALVALEAGLRQRLPQEAALARGREAGLATLESAVASHLSQ